MTVKKLMSLMLMTAVLTGFAYESYAEDTRPIIALTFDDGPSAYTGQILDILERYDAVATFFVVGHRLNTRAQRATVLRAHEMGSEIANHTVNHPRLTNITESEIISEIRDASAAIARITGASPPFYRPPFGQTNDDVVRISKNLGYAMVKWTLDPLDWRDRDPDIIYDRIMSNVQEGDIILVHDTRPTTARAMERVIPGLINAGFRLVTVSELLEYKFGGITPGEIYGTYTILD
jgi:peptidoglycan/xylan/chitin deacetylase (PgdA/CDA1 family)